MDTDEWVLLERGPPLRDGPGRTSRGRAWARVGARGRAWARRLKAARKLGFT